jgi:uncharacterized protein
VIDVNVHLFQWPFRRLSGDTPQELVAQLKRKGVRQAWAGSFEALFCRDVSGVNARLAAACRDQGRDFLVPFGVVNPKSPDWVEDLRRCHEEYRMPGIRLYPSYHRYTLTDADFVKLLSLAANRGLIVQIALSMEDPRTQIQWMMAMPTDPKPLTPLVAKLPMLKLVLLNGANWARSDDADIIALCKAENVYFDMAKNEGIGGLEALLAATSPDRVVFGSFFPFFYFESALLKVQEADLTKSQKSALTEGNARRLLKST